MQKEEKFKKAKKMEKRISSALDFFKTVLIYLLTVSMLTFAGIYINARQNAGKTAEIPLEKRIIFESKGTVLKTEINENHVSPLQITVTVENKSFTFVYNSKLISDVYENFIKKNIQRIFNPSTECQRLDKDEGDKLWLKCVENENSVYVKYAGNYIYPVIYAFLDKTWDIKNSADAFSTEREFAMVHELFIVDDSPVYGVAKDIDGNISVFIPEKESSHIIKSYINTDNLSAYNNNAGIISCEFLKDTDINSKTGINGNNIKNLIFPETFHLFDNYNIYSSVLKFSNPVLDEENRINTEQGFIKNLFEILNFNIESSLSYYDRNGITFVDGKNTIVFSRNGQIVYNYKSSDVTSNSSSGETGGVHLSKFLGSGPEYYTLYEKIKAASVFVGSLDRVLTGNEEECAVYLKNIFADSNDNLKITFSYYYEGINIKVNGQDEGIIITVNKDSFMEIKINSLYVTSQGMIKNMNPIVILGGIDEDIENTENAEEKYKLKHDKIQDKFIVNGFELLYNINYTNSNNNETDDLAKAEWVIK